jgi:hypothetical protein
MVEQHGPETGRLERRLEGRLVARGARVTVSARARALSERPRQGHERHGRSGDAERLEELASRDRSAIERVEQSGWVAHESSYEISGEGVVSGSAENEAKSTAEQGSAR